MKKLSLLPYHWRRAAITNRHRPILQQSKQKFRTLPPRAKTFLLLRWVKRGIISCRCRQQMH